MYSLIISEPEHKSVNRISQVRVGTVCRSSPERFLCGMKRESDHVCSILLNSFIVEDVYYIDTIIIKFIRYIFYFVYSENIRDRKKIT